MRLSVVIPACNEARVLPRLVRRLKRWRRRPEVIVVANGCTDNTVPLAKAAGAVVVDVPHRLGHDVGRAAGLALATGDVCLVLDADMLYSLSELEPFVVAVERGVDVALNRYPQKTSPRAQHPTAIAKRALNILLERPDLGAASLTAVPHALSRKAIRRLSLQWFATPPVAQAEAVLHDLCVEAVAHVPVGKRNTWRGKANARAVTRLILGDCVEAIYHVCEVRGSRAGFTDLRRRRDLLDTFKELRDDERPTYDCIAVVPARNEASTLPYVIRMVKQTRVDEVCVVSNGSKDDTAEVAMMHGALTEEVKEPLGHDIGRAIGCLTTSARRYVFSDGDLRLTVRDIRPFVRPPKHVDVALNNLGAVLPRHRQMDNVSIVKRFLNLALDRADLGVASMTAVPHSLTHRALDKIGVDSLAVPPLAQTKAILSGCTVKAVHGVDVVKTNRIRVQLHGRKYGRPLGQMIVGDHAEALHYLCSEMGPRGLFPDKSRNRKWLESWLEKTNQQERGRFNLRLGLRSAFMRQ